MSEALEAGHRKVLMMLPSAYRAEYAEEMLAVLMDGAKPGQTRPTVREVLSVAGLALRLRFAGNRVGDVGRAAGDVVRRAVLVFLMLEFGLLMQWNAYGARIGYSFVPVLLQAGIIVALVLGWSWCGRALCLTYVGFMIYEMPWGLEGVQMWWYAEIVLSAPMLAALTAAMVVFHRRAPRVARPGLWLLALTVITAAFWIRGKTVDHMWAFDIAHTPALPALIYAAAAIAALRQARSSPGWPAALALGGLPVAGGIMADYLTGRSMPLADSPRDTFYVGLAVGCECLLLATAVASLLYWIYRRHILVISVR